MACQVHRDNYTLTTNALCTCVLVQQLACDCVMLLMHSSLKDIQSRHEGCWQHGTVH